MKLMRALRCSAQLFKNTDLDAQRVCVFIRYYWYSLVPVPKCIVALYILYNIISNYKYITTTLFNSKQTTPLNVYIYI